MCPCFLGLGAQWRRDFFVEAAVAGREGSTSDPVQPFWTLWGYYGFVFPCAGRELHARMFTSGLDGRATARGFSPAVATRHTKFRIPGGAFLSCMGFLGIPQGVLVAVLVAVSRSLHCA